MDPRDYLSDRVFDGVRAMSPEDAARYHARLQRALARLAARPDTEGERE